MRELAIIRRTFRAALRHVALFTGLAVAAPMAAAQQTPPSATVVPGPEYAAGSTRQTLLGNTYRDLWTTPVRAEVLDLSRFAGGLTPVKLGGGNQTRSLKLQGANGRRYAFRLVDKEVTNALPRDLRNTVVDWAIQDQTSSQFPLGVLAAQRIERAAGLLIAPVRLFVMPDDPRLGEFRAEFAGQLGLMEERPDEGDDPPPFAGAERIAESDKLFKRLEDKPDERIDTRDYLTSRLVDLLIGDWDRHEGQLVWARYPNRDGGGAVWRPVPRDRDYSFVDYDGTLLTAARGSNPKLVKFTPRYPKNLTGYLLNPQLLDRRVLGELEAPVWDSVALALRQRLTNAVIDSAVAVIPPVFQARRGEMLRTLLRARRDSLPSVARRFYAVLTREASLYGTDEDERADIVRQPDGSLEVAIFEGKDGQTPYVRRRFDPRETREVRVFMRGGDDRVTVRGAGSPIVVRVIGGGGDDRFEDTGRGPTRFYDDRGKNEFLRGPDTEVDTRRFEAPDWERGNLRAPPREWGTSGGGLSPKAAWRTGVGPLAGVGVTRTHYGFRRVPFAQRTALSVLGSPRFGGRAGAFLHTEARGAAPGDAFTLDAEVSNLDVHNFFGYGNDTRTPDHQQRLWSRTARLEPMLHRGVGGRGVLSVGARLRYLDPEGLDSLRPRGGERSFTSAAALAEVTALPPDSAAFPRRGLYGEAGGGVTPFSTGGIGSYGETHAVVQAYLPAGGRWAPVLALRAGAKQVWGSAPVQDAATLGGWSTLRGYYSDRFTGDAATWGSAELRVPVTRAELIVKGDMGVIGLADAGRVYLDGRSPGGWHTAAGAGLWFAFLDRTRMVSVVWARGERNTVYLRFGSLF